MTNGAFVSPMRLASGAVHVWRVPVDAATAVACHLDDDERRRADAFARAADRQAFIARRGARRVILARYLGCAPGDLRFVSAPQGKPGLATTGSARLHFNAGGRGELAVIAVASDRAVGIDVEAIRPLPDLDALVRRMGRPAEAPALQALYPAARVVAFYRLWTGKEAYLKLRGWGLRVEPNAVSVEPAGSVDEPTGWVAGGPAADRARLTWLAVAPGYVAALAVVGAPPRIYCYDFMMRAHPPGIPS